MALLYFGSGQIGLMLALPPGYATAVWPASGIALGAALLYGWRLLPGVALGSLAINLMISIHANGLGLFEINWAIPALIACGAAIQAGIGAWLIKRRTDFPSALDEPGVVCRTLAWGGLVATTINASWSVMILHQAGVIPPDRWQLNWLTWWVGDSIGVLVFTPLILVWGIHKPYFDRTRAIMVSVVLGCTFSVAVLGFLLVTKLEARDRIRNFQAESQSALAQMQHRFADYESFSSQVRSLFYSHDGVSRSEFGIFTQDWLSKHPEVWAVQWAPVTTELQRSRLESELTRQLGKPTHILEIAPHGVDISSQQPEYLPLKFSEPFATSQLALGLDVLSEATRREALLTAARTGTPHLTLPVRLMLDRQGTRAVIMYTPIYRDISARHDWSNLKGVVAMVLKTQEVLAYLSNGTLPVGLRMTVTDQSTGLLLYGEAPEPKSLAIAKKMGLLFNAPSQLGQRQWSVVIRPSAKRLIGYESWLTWTVLVIGFLGTSLAVTFTLVTTGRRQYLERTITNRTRELTERNDELEDQRQKALEANHALESARSDAVKANQAKGQFLASMSHEIRTPMNAIIGFTQLLQASSLAGKDLEYLTHINIASRALLALINDILDFSKIEAGKLDLHEVSFRLDELLQNTAKQIMLPATAKGLEVALDIAPDVPLDLCGDSLRLGQILLNLCNNAVKFTDQGEIIIGVDLDSTPAGRLGQTLTLFFWVSDTGIGIPEQQLCDLFTPFTQADDSITRRYGGTGLGLAICYRLVELMGGHIGVKSTLDHGSTFHFSVPMKVRELPREKESFSIRPSLGRLHVLIVDDSPTARSVMISLFHQLAMDAVAVDSGEAALRAIIEAAWDKPFDLVLLDWQMPGWDGMETARRIREAPTLAKVPTLILMTGHAFTLQEGQVNTADFAASLIKPVTLALLHDTLLSVFQNSKGDPILTSKALPHFAPGRILLVEDNDVNRRLATEMLRLLGLSVVIARNGQEALEVLDQESDTIDLVLMDLHMPVMDGYKATTQIRQRLNAQVLPIVAMTAYAMPADRQKCLNVGMNAHLAKPVEIQTLAAMLARFLPLVPMPLITPSPNPLTIDQLAPKLRHLNILLLRQSLDARTDFEHLQPTLSTDFPQETQEIGSRLAKLDYPQARKILCDIARKMEISLD